MAHRYGIRNFTPLVLDGYSNTLIRLAPHPIVARVATLIVRQAMSHSIGPQQVSSKSPQIKPSSVRIKLP